MVERVKRKRNVKTRRRTGCITCRARRLKCDEGKPECGNCIKLGVPCAGYGTRIVFKDQTELLSQRASRRQKIQAGRDLKQVICDEPSVPAGNTHAFVRSNTEAPNSLCDAQETHSSAFTDATTHTELTGSDDDPVIEETSFQPVDFTEETRQSSDQTLQTTESFQHWEDGPCHHFGHFPGFTPNEIEGSFNTAALVEQTWRHNDTSDPVFQRLPAPSAPITFNERQACPPPDDFGIKATPMVPNGLLKSMKFTEDMLYYHHLRDSSPYGLLSVLHLNNILNAHYLDDSFFHAALALSAFKISQSEAPEDLRKKAAIHALEHFVTALGSFGKIQVEESAVSLSSSEYTNDPPPREKAVSWLSTVLFLAQFELQRGQMRLWYVHSRAAVVFLSQNLANVLESEIGESLIRSISRIAALLDIYDRTHSVRKRVASTEVSESLVESLRTSPLPYDRLLFIMPRLNKLEEDWRSSPRNHSQWEERIEGFRLELQAWKESLEATEIPIFDDGEENNTHNLVQGDRLKVEPFTIAQSTEPVRAATNFMHYLISLLRLDSMYPPNDPQKLTAPKFLTMLHQICRLAAGVPNTLCALVNAYGHGMLPALMNTYNLSDGTRADWIRGWIAAFPRDREGIWNVSRVQRLLAYLDEKHSLRGPESGWTIIRARMVDLEERSEEPMPGDDEDGSDRFFVEIYSKKKRGWSIDFVEIE